MGLLNFFKKNLKEEVVGSNVEVKINEYIVFVMSMINNLIDNQFKCDRSKLKNNGEIFYLNGQNGTKFDWNINEHLSPFYCFYKSGKGAIKFIINKDGTAVAYYYNNGEDKPCRNIQTEFSEKTAKDIAVLMYAIADSKALFDQPISNLEYTYVCVSDDMDKFDREDLI